MLSTRIVDRARLRSYLAGAAPTDKAEARAALREYMAYLQSKIDSAGITARPVADIYMGLNGVGKTQLARQKRDVVRIDSDNAMWHFDSMKHIADYFAGLAGASTHLKETSKKLLGAAKRNTDMVMNVLVQRRLPFSFEMTGHSAGAPIMIANLVEAGYEYSLHLTDAPKYVRESGLKKHSREKTQPVYLDPKVNEDKVSGVGKNLASVISKARELRVYWRDDVNQGLRLIAVSHAGGRIEIVDRKGMETFNAQSDILNKSEFKTVQDMMQHHSLLRRRALQDDTPHLRDYLGPCVLQPSV